MEVKTIQIPWWLGYLNFIIVQWLFFRLTRWIDEDGSGYGILIGVVPLTGWWNDYIKLSFYKHIKLI